ncbi:MAG TPA: acetyl-CoA hydrolase/transferase C-terminal domain-containing protein [Acidimicrobiales bacterium]|nr:acetyl-CoA hydrolase/transferase C-terminal domain-containing protein [Acidimicrobiales bacterium]
MRIVSEEQLVRELGRSEAAEPRVVASGNFATPKRLIDLFDATTESYRLFMLNAQGTVPCRDDVVLETPFVGPAMRSAGARLDYLPMRLSLVPALFARSRPPDVVLLHTSPPRSGKVSLGIEVNILVAAVEHVRSQGGLVVAQVNPHMPYTFGDGEIGVDDVDLAIEVDEELPSPSAHEPSDVDRAIGQQVAELVEDGATLQTGIGSIPDCTLGALTKRRDLAVWSEMFSDGILGLEQRGATDRARPIVASFLFGSAELYRWVDQNPRVRMTRTETTNDPSMIGRQPAMVSINGALQVDLYAQANASYVNGRIYSGFGGQSDFTVGAMHARGGRAVIALPSWHAKTASSTVVPALTSPVTSFQHSAIVSEQGCAHIFGRSQRAQARLITEQVAHPAAREELREAAWKMGLAAAGERRS